MQFHQSQRSGVRATGVAEHRAAFGKLRRAEGGHDVGAEQQRAVGGVHRHGHRMVRVQSGLPAVDLQVAGHAADRVGGAGLQVDVAVAVVVHCPAVDAAGHELRQAHGAGERTLHGLRVQAFAGTEHEEFLQLAAEVGAAVAAAGGEVEGQRRQGVDDAVVAGDAAVEGLHADDAHHHLGRHAMALFGAEQRRLVGLPEGDTGLDATRLDEARAVGGPVLGRAGGRRHHELLHRRHATRLGELLYQPLLGQAAAFGRLGGKAARLGVAGITGRRGGLVRRLPAVLAPRGGGRPGKRSGKDQDQDDGRSATCRQAHARIIGSAHRQCHPAPRAAARNCRHHECSETGPPA